MTLTCRSFRPAFTTAAARTLFLDPNNDVEAGTWVEHTLGTSLGVWGDANLLRADVVKILERELLTYVKRVRLAPLPAAQYLSDVIDALPQFSEPFQRLLRVNHSELDVQLGQATEAVPLPTNLDFLKSAGYTEVLCLIARQRLASVAAILDDNADALSRAIHGNRR